MKYMPDNELSTMGCGCILSIFILVIGMLIALAFYGGLTWLVVSILRSFGVL